MSTRKTPHIHTRRKNTTALLALIMFVVLSFNIHSPGVADDQVQTDKGPNLVRIKPGSDVITDPYHQLEAVGGEPSLESAFANIRDDQESDELRYWSAVVVGQSGHKESLPTLLGALNDPNESARAGALVGLKYMRNPRAITEVTNVLEHDTSPSVRQLALVTLVKTPDDSVGDILVRNASSPLQHSELRMAAIQGIEYLRLAGAADKLRPLLLDGNADVRALVAVFLSRSEPDDSIPHLVEAALSLDTSHIVRAETILRLQEVTGEDFGIGDKSTAPRAPIRVQSGLARNKVQSWWTQNKETIEKQKKSSGNSEE